MKKLIWVIFTAICFQAYGQSTRLSSEAEISILTFGPWQGEVYSAFGHSAIRVYDPVNGYDFAYNYGVFDFNQPNFYINYTRGLLSFELGVYIYPDFRDYYIRNNRSVTEQILNLSQGQKQAIFNFLEWNALLENKTYRYDYFYNNCSSKIRDVFFIQLKNVIAYDGSYIDTNYTIRQLTDIYLKQQPWGDLGIDICLGLPMDKKASKIEYMFLPDYLQSAFDHTTIKIEGKTMPIVREKKMVYVAQEISSATSWFHPWIIFSVFLILTLGLSARDWKRKKLSKWFDALLFGATGLIGVLLTLLWFATDHQAASKNFNLLWALPTNLIIVVFFRSKNSPLIKKYFTFVTILSLLLLLTWFVLPQQLNVFLIPFVAALTIRAFTISRLL